MWKKTDQEEPAPQPQPQPQPAPPVRTAAAPPKERATIGPSIEIKGDLTGGEDLHVEGQDRTAEA
jgi:hypothetical protein